MQQRASQAFPHAEDAIAAFQPNLNFARAYTPDLFNGFGKLGQVAGYYDGNGHYVRAATSAPEPLQIQRRQTLEPITPSATVRRLRRLGPRPAPLPRRRHARPPPTAPTPSSTRRSAAPASPPPNATRPTRPPDHEQATVIVAAALVAAVVAVVLLVSGGGGSSNGYVVRAIFDNGGFMVKGEQVRVAGANVGDDRVGRRHDAGRDRRLPQTASRSRSPARR